MLKKLSTYPFLSVVRTSARVALVNFKLRTEGSYIGILWYLLEPLFVFTILLLIKNVVGIEQEHYPLYLFLGLIMFNFFAGATNHAAKAIIANAEFIKWLKIRFEIFTIAYVLQFLLSHSLELVIFAVMLVWFNVGLTGLIWYPFVFFLFFLFTLGVGFILATCSVYTNDLANAWRVLISRLLWLGTPIFYTLEEGSILHTINLFNPLFYFLELGRKLVIYHQNPGFYLISITILLSVISFTSGIYIFVRHRKIIPEKI